jgi:hypothetical protein
MKNSDIIISLFFNKLLYSDEIKIEELPNKEFN